MSLLIVYSPVDFLRWFCFLCFSQCIFLLAYEMDVDYVLEIDLYVLGLV